MPATKTLFLVRHGQYQNTAPEGEEADGPLTELGREQVALLADRLKEFPIKKIIYSPMIRATETATLLSAAFPGIEMEVSPILVECIPAVPNDPLLSQVVKDWFAKIPAEEVAKGGPQASQVFDTYFQPHAGEEEHFEIIVSHGNLIAYLICRALKAPPAAWINTDIMNCGLSEIAVRPSGFVKLVSHNDTGHLPHAKKTWT